MLRLLQQHARLAFVTLACTTFFMIVAPLNFGLGANAEEVIGLIDVAPTRLYPEGVTVRERATSGAGLRSSDELPVWGYQDDDGSFLPLMIDGHVSALPFYGARLLVRAGGLSAARLQSTVLSVVALLLILAFASRVGGARVGVLAVLLAGTSPHLMFVFSMVRPDEQVHSFAHMAAVLCAMTFATTGRGRWLYACAFLLGLGVAAKNTALWAFVALSISALCFRLVPRARRRDWGIAAVLFVLPLVPQALYLVLGDSTGAMSQRVAMVSSPWESLSPSGLAASVSTFASAVGHGGTLVGGHVAGVAGRAPVLPGVGFLLFAGVLVAVAGAFVLTVSVPLRAFGAGLGLLLLQHLAFYYRGEAYYELLAPWVPVALAVAGVGLWEAAGAVRSVRARGGARVLVVAAGLLVFASNGTEVARYHEAVVSPQSSMFDHHLQLMTTSYLGEAGIQKFYTTTYGTIGVYEMYTQGRVRPVHLFPYFRAVAEGGPAGYRAAWLAILRRLGPGTHYIMLAPNPSPVDTSPCRDGNLIATQFWPAVSLLGGEVKEMVEHQNGKGVRTLVLARVTLPGGAPTR